MFVIPSGFNDQLVHLQGFFVPLFLFSRGGSRREVGFEEIVSREIMSSVTLLLPRKIFIFMFCH